MMKLRVGMRLGCPVDSTVVMVVRAPSREVDLTCAGVSMVPNGQPGPDGAVADQSQLGGSVIGKRYVDEGIGLELLCTKAGDGTLACNGMALRIGDAKALPTSD